MFGCRGFSVRKVAAFLPSFLKGTRKESGGAMQDQSWLSKSRARILDEMFARADGLQRGVLLSWIVVSSRVTVELARWL